MKNIIMSIVAVMSLGFFLLSNVNAKPSLQPEIENIQIKNNTQGGNVYLGGTHVSARVRIPGVSGLRLSELLLSYRSLRTENAAFTTLGKMRITKGRYVGKLPILNYGPYEVKLTAKLNKLVISNLGGRRPKDTVITAFEAFNVEASKECFTFNSSDEDWTKSTVVNARTQESVEGGNCTSSIGVPAGKIISAIGASDCFPSTIDGASSNYWRFDFISPDLTSIKSWKKIKGSAVNVGANVPVLIQPMVTYRKENGDVRSLVVVNSSGEPIFDDVGDAIFSYKDVFSNLNVPAKATILNFRVRVFGRPIDTAGHEAFVAVNTVCPIVSNRPKSTRVIIRPTPRPIITLPIGMKLPRK